MSRALNLIFILALALAPVRPAFAAEPVAAEDVLQWLKHGNRRFTQGQTVHPNQDVGTARGLRAGQKPKVAILTCCDSRVDPGTIFDLGLGDAFEVEVAGNFLTPEGRASLKYAVEHLGVRTILVMGHGKCGAVGAAVARNADPDYAPLINPLMAAVELAERRGGPTAEMVDRAVLANVELQMRELTLGDGYLAKMARSGELRVYGAFYDLGGKVHFYDSPDRMAATFSHKCPLHRLIGRVPLTASK